MFMNTREVLLKELDTLPDPVLNEILQYVQFLKSGRTDWGNKRPTPALETALASESSLKKDWLTPEEDEAWKDL
jgi:hypothetical protein